jgi:hypothetical protein
MRPGWYNGWLTEPRYLILELIEKMKAVLMKNSEQYYGNQRTEKHC